jgi:hypothetical protein
VKPTGARALLFTLALFAVITWAVLHAVYASLPPLTWTGVPALLIAAGIEGWLAWDLRGRIRGRDRTGGKLPPGRQTPPLFVARAVALAKATSQVAALIAGVCVGFMIYLSGMTGAPTPRADLVDASVSFGASLILMAAALYLEHSCRIPPGDGTADEPPPPPRESPFGH